MSAIFSPRTGYSMALYLNTGTTSSPVFNLVSEVGDVSISDLSRVLAQLKRRANGYTKNLPAMMDSMSVEFRLHFGLGKTVYDLIRAAFFNATPYIWLVLAAPNPNTTGNQGLSIPAVIEQFPWDQPLENVSGHDVRLAITYMEESGTEVDPFWYIV